MKIDFYNVLKMLQVCIRYFVCICIFTTWSLFPTFALLFLYKRAMCTVSRWYTVKKANPSDLRPWCHQDTVIFWLLFQKNTRAHQQRRGRRRCSWCQQSSEQTTWWGRRGRRRSWAAPGGNRWKPAAPPSARSLMTRTRATCTLETRTHTHTHRVNT